MVKDVRLSVHPGYVSGHKAPCPQPRPSNDPDWDTTQYNRRTVAAYCSNTTKSYYNVGILIKSKNKQSDKELCGH
jgi:hypothetical protein